MKGLIGVLFAGGRGTRLGQITQYVSKPFVPAYDRPVFLHPLAQLRQCGSIDEIVILTNTDNDETMKKAGYRTIVQDDAQVHDMWSGLRYLRGAVPGDRDAVLIPCDNVSEISVDALVENFRSGDFDVAFSVMPVGDRKKLTEMGVYDPASRRVCYKPSVPPSNLGVIAPYVIRGEFDPGPISEAEAFNQGRTVVREYKGPWFDVGDPDTLLDCSVYLRERGRSA